MSDYKTDLEITYAVKQGHHNFNEIYVQVDGSKLKFSQRLKLLVKDGIIVKSKEERPYYSLGDFQSYEEIQNVINRIKRNALTIEKGSKKYSNKKLLQASVKTIIIYLTHISLLTFHASITEYRTSQIAETEMAKELLQYIKKMMKILEKRDVELPVMCYNLVKNQMSK